MTTFVALISFAAGGGLSWFAKEKIQAAVIGGEAVVAALKAKARALKARLGGR